MSFFSGFCLCPRQRKKMKGKTNPAMDLLLYGEADGTNFVSVE